MLVVASAVPNMPCQVLAPGETEVARGKVCTKEPLPFLLLRWPVRVTRSTVIVGLVLVVVVPIAHVHVLLGGYRLGRWMRRLPAPFTLVRRGFAELARGHKWGAGQWALGGKACGKAVARGRLGRCIFDPSFVGALGRGKEPAVGPWRRRRCLVSGACWEGVRDGQRGVDGVEGRHGGQSRDTDTSAQPGAVESARRATAGGKWWSGWSEAETEVMTNGEVALRQHPDTAPHEERDRAPSTQAGRPASGRGGGLVLSGKAFQAARPVAVVVAVVMVVVVVVAVGGARGAGGAGGGEGGGGGGGGGDGGGGGNDGQVDGEGVVLCRRGRSGGGERLAASRWCRRTRCSRGREPMDAAACGSWAQPVPLRTCIARRIAPSLGSVGRAKRARHGRDLATWAALCALAGRLLCRSSLGLAVHRRRPTRGRWCNRIH